MQTLLKHLRILVVLMLAACSEHAASDGGKKTDYQIGERLPAATRQTPARPVSYREINWDELIPSGWDPAEAFANLNLDKLQDADPRAEKALAQMRKIWDEAPVNPDMNGQAVRIPGFVVPLDANGGKLREFLLVPYFGGCIHVPPPPANQIIHVHAAIPLNDTKAMDAVWVNGILATTHSDSQMGSAGYKMEAQKVEAFQWSQ
ncbi:MAG: DUF3299 domain-containing protein [Zoogloeaceae bacterium]|jgi:hypothetical protein|nr:DUF3299 domain-containing protein [Zoogloeaceae bacterium]